MRMQIRGLLVALGCVAPLLVSCSDVAGRTRADAAQLQGVYLAKFDRGQERLELKADGTYTQEFSDPAGPIRQSGKWELEHHFFDGSEVSLMNALLSEDDLPTQRRIGTRILNVHRRQGRLGLALNESADWYYERVRE